MKQSIRWLKKFLFFFSYLLSTFFVEEEAFSQLYASSRSHTYAEKAAWSQNSVFPEEISKKKLKIGLFNIPPFSFQKADGTWEGVAVNLIKKIALDNDLQYEFICISDEEKSFFIDDFRRVNFSSKYDIILWSIPDIIEPDQYSFDYSLPYYVGGMTVVQKNRPTTFLSTLIHIICSRDFLASFCLLCMYLALGTTLIWIFERREKTSSFRKGIREGLWDGFWWCTSITSTVFPCNLIPISTAGRWLAIGWMFISITFLSGLIGTVNSSLTVNKIRSPIHQLRDLSYLKVVAVENSSTADFLSEQMISYKVVKNIEMGLNKIDAGEADVFIGPEPLIRYYLKNNERNEDFLVNPISFSMQYYSFILPAGSQILHPLNYEILRTINTIFWKKTLYEYMGNIPSIH